MGDEVQPGSLLTDGVPEDQGSADETPKSEEGSSDKTGGSGAPADWRAQLPRDLQGNEELGKLGGFSELAQRYLELRKTGGDLTIPAQDAPREEWDTFYEKTGRPKEAAEYDAFDEHVPERVRLSDASKELFKEVAHREGLSKRQGAALFNWLSDALTEGYKIEANQRNETRKESLDVLQKDWAGVFPERMVEVERGWKALGNPEARELMISSGVGDHPAVLRIFQKAGAMFREGSFPMDAKQAGGTPLEEREYPNSPELYPDG